MRSIILSFLLLANLVGGASIALAEVTAQFAAAGLRAPNDPNVNGFRFALIYGQNDGMRGLDLGVLSMSESENLSGAAFVLGIHKLNRGMKSGAAFSLVNIHDGDDSGLNAAFVNKVNNATGAVDLGFVNIAEGTTMVDIGGFNMAKSSTAQVGFINVAEEIKGFQLGFLNMAENGFLPVFPIFNFPKQ
jgi:hypothetical protein